MILFMIMICLIVVASGVFIKVIISIINKYSNNIINFNFTYMHKKSIIKRKNAKKKKGETHEQNYINREAD